MPTKTKTPKAPARPEAAPAIPPAAPADDPIGPSIRGIVEAIGEQAAYDRLLDLPTVAGSPGPVILEGVANLPVEVSRRIAEAAGAVEFAVDRAELARDLADDPIDQAWRTLAEDQRVNAEKSLLEMLLLAHLASSPDPTDFVAGSMEGDLRRPCGVIAGRRLWLALDPELTASAALASSIPDRVCRQRLYAVDLSNLAVVDFRAIGGGR